MERLSQLTIYDGDARDPQYITEGDTPQALRRAIQIMRIRGAKEYTLDRTKPGKTYFDGTSESMTPGKPHPVCIVVRHA